MTEEKLASIFEAVKVMLLRPTDVLVFRSPGKISKAQEESVREYLTEQTGHERIVVLDAGADLAVLRPDEDETLPPLPPRSSWKFWRT